ncbi:MAG: multicopper oxidase domain-containing protein, partial [Verrucomicrobiae bacterium]|nr:multicopper oxidase domain-containing protein [Verrucomicrobiae bacterium]
MRTASAFGASMGMQGLLPSYSLNGQSHGSHAASNSIHLTIQESPVTIGGKNTMATAINGTVPGPLVRLKEGENTILQVTNRLKEDSSIHWHGLILPYEMDGVPGLSYDGIQPGETFAYQFPVEQNGTYWYHSHSGLQEQTGVYGP